MGVSALAVAVALALDLAAGEPPTRLHPVAWFGRLVGPLDRSWGRPRAVGLVAAALLPVGAAAAVAVPVAGLARWRPLAGAALAGVALALSTSLRRLLVVARGVARATEADPDAARERLRALAGRDAAALSPAQVRSAAVESVAENLADGLVAPLLAFALAAGGVGHLAGPALAPAAGAAAAAWVKAVNTMDSMLGYRAKPVGWAAARLDDAVMYLPARASAVLLAAAALAPASLAAARRWLDGVPSPNSGWPMGVAAAALAVRLEKPGVYVLNPDAALPSVADAERAVRQAALAGALAYVLAGVVAWS